MSTRNIKWEHIYNKMDICKIKCVEIKIKWVVGVLSAQIQCNKSWCQNHDNVFV